MCEIVMILYQLIKTIIISLLDKMYTLLLFRYDGLSSLLGSCVGLRTLLRGHYAAFWVVGRSSLCYVLELEVLVVEEFVFLFLTEDDVLGHQVVLQNVEFEVLVREKLYPDLIPHFLY